MLFVSTSARDLRYVFPFPMGRISVLSSPTTTYWTTSNLDEESWVIFFTSSSSEMFISWVLAATRK